MGKNDWEKWAGTDCERVFSAYGDILTPKQNRQKTENTEIFMCLYFGDGADLEDDFNDLNSVPISDIDKEMDIDPDNNDFLW